MTEITRVPLLPIAAGSLSKLWLGVFVAALGAVVVAYEAMPPLVKVSTLTPGAGPSPVVDDYAMVKLSGQLDDGTVFQPSEQTVLPINNTIIPGFARALQQMQAGGSYKVDIPASLGFGAKAMGPVPANSNLHFTIQLLDFETADQYQQQQMMMSRLRQMQAQQKRGAAGGAANSGAPAPGGAPPSENSPPPGNPE